MIQRLSPILELLMAPFLIVGLLILLASDLVMRLWRWYQS